MTHNQVDKLLTESEASNIVGFSRNTLRAWRVTGRQTNMTPPPFVKCGRAVRYRLSDLEQWMSSQIALHSTSDRGVVA